MDFDVQTVLVDISLAQLCHHAQVVGIDVCKRYLDIVKFRHGQKVCEKTSCETDASCTDKCYFK